MKHFIHPDDITPPRSHTNGMGSGNERLCSDDRIWKILSFCLNQWHCEFDRLAKDLKDEWSIWEEGKASEAPTFRDLDHRIRFAVGVVEKKYTMLRQIDAVDLKYDEIVKNVKELRDRIKMAQKDNEFEKTWTGRDFVVTWRRLFEGWRNSIDTYRIVVAERIARPMPCFRFSQQKIIKSGSQNSSEEDHAKEA